jgi:hypothetical protein
MSEKATKQWSDPLARKRQSDNKKKYYEDPIHREEQSIRVKKIRRERPETCYVKMHPEVGIEWYEKLRIYKLSHPEIDQAQSERMKASNPMKDPEIAKKSINTRIEYYKTHPFDIKLVGYSKGSYFRRLRDGRIYWLRSTYEIRYAGILNSLNIDWEYEIPFYIDKLNSIYHPDFYLPDYDLYIEVKGYWSDNCINKIKEFNKQYNNIHLIIVYLNNINDLEHEIGCYSPIDLIKFGTDLNDQIITWKGEE